MPEAVEEQNHSQSGWRKLLHKSRSQVKAFHEEHKETIRYATDTIEVIGVAGALGYMHGRKGGVYKLPVLNTPIDLSVALLAKVVGFAGWAGNYTADVHAGGNGAAAVYIYSVAAKWGSDAREKAGEKLNRPLTQAEADKANVEVRNIVAGPGGARRFAPNNIAREPANGNAQAQYARAVGFY